MSFFQSQQPIVIPDPVLDVKPGPSANNIPIPSSTPGAPVVGNINNGNAALYYTILPTFFPQPTLTSTYVYRFTFIGNVTVGSFAVGTPGGNISVKVSVLGANAIERDIGGSAAYASPTATLGINCSFSILFKPVLGDTLKIRVLNSTGGNLTNVTLTPASEGCGIELVSTESAPQLIFS